MIDLDENAYALRPVRLLKNGRLRVYCGITFPKDPYGGCKLALRRIESELKEDKHNLLIDILDKDGGILQDFPVTRLGFEILRQKLGLVIEKESEDGWR